MQRILFQADMLGYLNLQNLPASSGCHVLIDLLHSLFESRKYTTSPECDPMLIFTNLEEALARHSLLIYDKSTRMAGTGRSFE